MLTQIGKHTFITALHIMQIQLLGRLTKMFMELLGFSGIASLKATLYLT